MDRPKSAEEAIIIDMLDFVKEHEFPQIEVEIISINDNKLLHNDINEKWDKVGNYANDAGWIVTKIKDLI